MFKKSAKILTRSFFLLYTYTHLKFLHFLNIPSHLHFILTNCFNIPLLMDYTDSNIFILAKWPYKTLKKKLLHPRVYIYLLQTTARHAMGLIICSYYGSMDGFFYIVEWLECSTLRLIREHITQNRFINHFKE